MRRLTDAELLKLVGGLYDAALDPALWPAALTELTGWFGGWGTQLLLWDEAAQTMPFSAVGGDIPAEGEKAYGDYYGRIDPRRQFINAVPVGTLFACNRQFDEGFVARSEFYQDFLLPLGGRHLAAARLALQDEVTTIVGFHRAPGQGGFEATDLAELARVLPHLARASEIHRRLGGLGGEAEAREEALDRVAVGVAILDRAGRVLFANAALRAMAARGDGMKITTDGIGFGHPAARDALAGLIGAAVATAGGGVAAAGGAALAPRPSGRRPYQVSVAPLPGRGAMPGRRQAAAIVLVGDPDRTASPPAALLRSLYGLTRREAELALALADGSSLVRVAEHLQISEGTARAHLTAVFRKTGTLRQPALAALIARLGA